MFVSWMVEQVEPHDLPPIGIHRHADPTTSIVIPRIHVDAEAATLKRFNIVTRPVPHHERSPLER
jgi:hypothetical protein